MKKHYLYLATFLLTSLFMLPMDVFGQTTSQINTTYSNGYSSGASPFRGYYEDARNQPIYLANELSAAGLQDGAVITSIAWYVSAAYSSLVYNNFEIKMGHTAIAEITKAPYMIPADHTTVFSGIANTKGTAGTWYTIDLSTPFVYIAGQTLVIETCFNNTSYTSSDLVSYSYDPGVNLQTYSYNDGTTGCTDAAEYTGTYRPVVKLTYTNPSVSNSDYYVATTGSNSNDGSSGYPFATLTYAISQAINGDTLNVAAGTYTDEGITLTKSVTIQGAGSAFTIFDGDQSGPFMFIDANNVTLKGVTIKEYAEDANTQLGDNPDGGGAIEIDASQTGLIFEDCIFHTNVCYNTSSSTTDDGGAIYMQAGVSADFKQCIFHNNRAGSQTSATGGYYGGAVRGEGGSGGTINFYSCLFYENEAYMGVAIDMYGGSASNAVTTNINQCTFADNISDYNSINASPVRNYYQTTYLRNCAFANNMYDADGTPGQALVGYSYGGTDEIYNCETTGSSSDNGFTGAATTDQIASFRDADNDDYTLTSTSGFISGGSTSNWPSIGDMYGGAYQTAAEVGCFEYCASATWDGSSGTDFSTAANWNTNHPRCNNLTIANVSNDPVLGEEEVTINGNITISSGGSLTISSNESGAYLAITGDFTNSGTFTHSGSAPLKFIGSAEQTINTGGSTLNNVEVDGAGLKMNGNKMTIAGTLTLTNGGINTDGNILELTHENPNNFTGWSNANFITATSAAGALRLHIDNDGSSSAVYTFPVGLGSGSTNYARLDLVNKDLTTTSGSAFNYLDVYVEDDSESGNNHSQYLSVYKLGTKGVYASMRTFYMIPDNQPNSGTYGLRMNLENLTFGWGKGLATSADDNKMFLAKADHTLTNGTSDYSCFDGTTTATGTTTLGYIQQTGFTSFSKGKGVIANNELPIELLDFNAEVSDEDLIDLSWTTASEINNDFFTIERSRDAVDFDIMVTVPGAGNSNEMLYYEAEDTDPMLGVSYYRLKQTDYDGQHSYSKIVSVKNLKELNFNVMPNPTTERLTVTFGKVEGNTVFVMTPEYKADIKIFNTAGKLVYKKKFDGTFYKFTINVMKLPEGMYYVNLKANDELYKTSFLKQ